MCIAEARQMMFGVAKCHIDHREALEVMADVELVDDSHRAVQLDRLLADEARGLSYIGLRARYGSAASAGSSPAAWIAAMMAIERACSAAINMSAIRCCSAWKLPIRCRTVCGFSNN